MWYVVRCLLLVGAGYQSTFKAPSRNTPVNTRKYAVYFDKRNTHISIHGPGYIQRRKRGGIHAY